MNITTFPKLKQRQIIVWRVVIWLILTFWEVPKRLLLYLLDFPLSVIYHICIGIGGIIKDLTEITYNAVDLFVRYFKVCKHLIHETAEAQRTGGVK